jgi:hypothetical protein
MSFVLLDFEKERRRIGMAKLSIPGWSWKKHYFFFPGSTEWFAVNDMTAGQHAEYMDLSDTIRFIREPIKQEKGDDEEPKERVIEERSYPSGTRMFQRFRILVDEWSLETVDGKSAPINEDTWKELPPGWTQVADQKIVAINPELIGGTREDRDKRILDEKLLGEVKRPETQEKSSSKAAPAT